LSFGETVTVVVDVDLIEHVLAELVEVRAARRSLKRDVVGDQGDGIRLVRTDERVDIGTVGHRVLGDPRRLAMGRHERASQSEIELASRACAASPHAEADD
jgi:hypothetical protein